MTNFLDEAGATMFDGSISALERMVGDAERLLTSATRLAKNSPDIDTHTTVEISGRLSDAAFSCRIAGAVLKKNQSLHLT